MQSIHYLKALSAKMPNISVVGIAGPGDPFANPVETLHTMRLAKQEFPDMIFCLSTNGLDAAPCVAEIAEIGVSHVTVTLNSFRPETLSEIYRWVRYNRRVYRNREAGEVLLEQQLKTIDELKKHGIFVKVNTVVCPGINDREMGEIAQQLATLGVDTMNCIPLYPTEETDFESLSEPSKEQMTDIKSAIAQFLPAMTHCARCRADAAGLLGHDNTEAMQLIGQFSSLVVDKGEGRTRVAVASNEGLLVNLHLGEARKMYIFEQSKNGYHFVGTRSTPPEGRGLERWQELACRTLADCCAVLVAGIGESPMQVMQENGIRVIQMNGLIDAGLDAIYLNLPLKTLCRSEYTRCGEACRGTGSGCG
jgi:nitrogen fixation protein NifB